MRAEEVDRNSHRGTSAPSVRCSAEVHGVDSLPLESLQALDRKVEIEATILGDRDACVECRAILRALALLLWQFAGSLTEEPNQHDLYSGGRVIDRPAVARTSMCATRVTA